MYTVDKTSRFIKLCLWLPWISSAKCTVRASGWGLMPTSTYEYTWSWIIGSSILELWRCYNNYERVECGQFRHIAGSTCYRREQVLWKRSQSIPRATLPQHGCTSRNCVSYLYNHCRCLLLVNYVTTCIIILLLSVIYGRVTTVKPGYEVLSVVFIWILRLMNLF